MPLAEKMMVKISSNESRRCPECNEMLHAGETEEFQNTCNHLLAHGLKCLHVGQETITGDDGPWQTTIAVFGK
jgi:hypothetical protein